MKTAAFLCIITVKEKHMTDEIKLHISYLICRTIGTISFVRRLEWRKLLAWLHPEAGDKVLDVASGSGELSLLVAKKGCLVSGVDLSEDGIKFARRLLQRAGIPGDFKIGDAEHLPYPDGYFDKVICSSALEHFSNDVQALQEMKRVLKPGGKLVLTVDSLNYPINDKLKALHKAVFSVVHYYTRDDFRNKLNLVGLETQRSEYLLNSWLPCYFYRLYIRFQKPLIFWLVVSLLLYPVFLVSEKLFRRKDSGYTLITEAKKLL